MLQLTMLTDVILKGTERNVGTRGEEVQQDEPGSNSGLKQILNTKPTCFSEGHVSQSI